MHHTSRIELIPLDRLEFLVQVSEFIDNDWKTQSHRVELETHAYRRSQERRIGLDEIAAAMFFGYSEWKQGVCFHALTRGMVPSTSGLEYRRSEGLIVICDECSAHVKTCFRRKDPVTYIKKKPKYTRSRERLGRLRGVLVSHREVHELYPYGVSRERVMSGTAV